MRTIFVLIAVFALSGCALQKSVLMLPTDGGEPMKATFKSPLVGSSGDVEGHLPDGRSIIGRWTRVRSSVDLALVSVSTPRGPITAAGLVQSGSPTGVATLRGEGVTVICVYSGSHSNGVAYCGDSDGRRYVGNW